MTDKKQQPESSTPDLGIPAAADPMVEHVSDAEATASVAAAIEAAQGQGIGAPDRFTPEFAHVERTLTYPYFFGLYPDAPQTQVTLAGQCFTKFHRRQELDDEGKWSLGSKLKGGPVTCVTLEFLERLCDVLPRRVVRWAAGGMPADQAAGGHVLPQEQQQFAGRRGAIINVWTEEMIEAHRRSGYAAYTHVSMRGDEFLAQYAFCVPCPGGYPPHVLPAPIAPREGIAGGKATGIVFPKDIDMQPMLSRDMPRVAERRDVDEGEALARARAAAGA